VVIYTISDIHGELDAFQQALELIDLSHKKSKLILLGDYIHGGYDSYGVLNKIIGLQREHGEDKIIALVGNHELMFLGGSKGINATTDDYDIDNAKDDEYLSWIEDLPFIHEEDNLIFAHAGVDEDEEDPYESDTYNFTEKDPTHIGIPYGDRIIIAGHKYTSQITGDPRFDDIYYDGAGHYYIDGDVLSSGRLNILKIDTEAGTFMKVTEFGEFPVLPYGEEE
jgi:serine/threonine protein phosphatase 1